MGQREEIERLIGEAYASLRLQEWTEFNRKISELALYPRGLTTDIIKEKMRWVSEPRAMNLAYIHEAVTAFPLGQSEEHKQKEATETPPVAVTKLAVVPPTTIEVPEVKYPLPKLAIETRSTAQQRWVATLIEAQGSFYTKRERKNKVVPEDYRYEYLTPIFWMEMFDKEPMTIFAELTGLPLHHYPPRYVCWAERETAVAMARWAIPFLMPNGERQRDALRMLRAFQEHSSIKVR